MISFLNLFFPSLSFLLMLRPQEKSHLTPHIQTISKSHQLCDPNGYLTTCFAPMAPILAL